jgi:hypothetical protein
MRDHSRGCNFFIRFPWAAFHRMSVKVRLLWRENESRSVYAGELLIR